MERVGRIQRPSLRQRSGSTEEELLNLLRQEHEPKGRGPTFLDRVFAPFRALGSVPDAAYRTMYEGANPFATYGKNLLGSLGTTFLGTPQKEYKEASDIAMREGALLGQDMGSKVARSALDIGASIATNPLTYVGLGPAKLAAALTKPSARAALSATGKMGKGTKALDKLESITTNKTMSEALEAITKTKGFGDDVASAFFQSAKNYGGTLTEAGKRIPSIKDAGSVRFMGQTISKNPVAGEVAKGLINPAYGVSRLLGKGSRTFMPAQAREASKKFYDVFDKAKASAMMGPGRADIGLIAGGAVQRKGQLQGLTQIEGAPLRELARKVPKGWTEREAALHIDKLRYDPKLKQALFDGVPLDLARLPQDQKKFLREFEKFAREHTKKANWGIEDLFEMTGKELPQKLPESMSKKAAKALAEPKGYVTPTTPGEAYKSIMKKPANSYDELMKKFTGASPMKDRSTLDATGKLIDPEVQAYLFHDPVTATKRWIQNHFGEDAQRVLDDPRVAKAITQKGEVDMDLVERVTRGIGVDQPASASKGLGLKERLARQYKTIEEGERAGLKYDTDIFNLIEKQSSHQLNMLDDIGLSKSLLKARDVTGKSYFKNVRTEKLSEAVDMPGAGRVYTDRHTKRVLDNYFDNFKSQTGLEDMLSGIDKVMFEWKGYVTAKGPGAIRYHARNFVDDNIRMVLGGARAGSLPSDYRVAWEVRDFGRLAREKGMDAAMREYKPRQASEIAKFLKATKRQVSDNPVENIKMLWQESIDEGVFTLATKAQSEAFDAAHPMVKKGKLGHKIEDVMTLKGKTGDWENDRRIAMYINTLRQGKTKAEGFEAVKRTLFDYQDLSAVERGAFRRLIPFYSFFKNNVRFQLETMFHDPVAYSKFVHAFDGLQSGFIGPDRDKFDAMPEYMQRRYSLPVGEKDGQLQMLTSLGLSFDDLEEMDTEGVIGRLSPLIKMGIEQATGYDAFRRAPIEDSLRGGDLYKDHPLKHLIGYKETERDGWTQATVDPHKRYWLENLPFLSSLSMAGRAGGRTVMPAVRGGTDTKYGDISPGLHDWLLPGKIHGRDIESSKRRTEREKEEELYKLLYRKGQADRFSRYYIPADIRDNLLKELK